MAKKKNKTLLIVGVGVAAVAVYYMTRPKTPAVTTPAPGGPVTAPTGNPSLAATANNIISLVKSLFGSSSSPATAPPLAQTTVGPSSPAASIPYINPIVPAIPISVPDATGTSYSGGGDLIDFLT